jgi:hypothetical protein
MSLRLDWCSHEAAKYAVENWHYSRRMPVGKLVKVGAWEDSQYIGCVVFGQSANYLLGAPYGLVGTEICELVRIALRKHAAPVSRIAAIALRMMRASQPGLRLVVSYADPEQSHRGGIYQAMNWVYAGRSAPSTQYFYENRWQHSREIRSGAFGQTRKVADYSNLPTRSAKGKHKYLYPLDDEMRKRIQPLAMPYPKRASEAGDDPQPAGTAAVQH